jgi:cell wall-associated NlpC family hydrolase
MKTGEISKVDTPFDFYPKRVHSGIEKRFHQMRKVLHIVFSRKGSGFLGRLNSGRFVFFLFVSISIFAIACSPKQQRKARIGDQNSDLASRVVALAKQYEGAHYKYGGQGPKSFDCSGFTQFIYSKAGVNIPRRSKDQARTGKKISARHAKKGDLIVLTKGRKVQHVGIISDSKNGDLYVTHASTSKGVITENMSSSPYWESRIRFARRVLP